MSRILEKTKTLYRKVIFVELFFLFLSSLSLVIYQGDYGVSFLFGAMSSFIPQVLLIGYVFFRRNTQYSTNKVTVLYMGEILKFTLSIILIASVFIFYQTIHILSFFSGFIVFLSLNIVLPVYFYWQNSKNKID